MTDTPTHRHTLWGFRTWLERRKALLRALDEGRGIGVPGAWLVTHDGRLQPGLHTYDLRGELLDPRMSWNAGAALQEARDDARILFGCEVVVLGALLVAWAGCMIAGALWHLGLLFVTIPAIAIAAWSLSAAEAFDDVWRICRDMLRQVEAPPEFKFAANVLDCPGRQSSLSLDIQQSDRAGRKAAAASVTSDGPGSPHTTGRDAPKAAGAGCIGIGAPTIIERAA